MVSLLPITLHYLTSPIEVSHAPVQCCHGPINVHVHAAREAGMEVGIQHHAMKIADAWRRKVP